MRVKPEIPRITLFTSVSMLLLSRHSHMGRVATAGRGFGAAL